MAQRGRRSPNGPGVEDRGRSRWLLLQYRPSALFSLRMSQATSSGGKTLLVPTPYAFKMALVDVGFRLYGLGGGRSVFEEIKGREVRFRPPAEAVVTQTFVKLLRQARGQEEESAGSEGPFQRTIGYREFCYYGGILTVALGVGGLAADRVNDLVLLAAHVNYLGKRGSFMQFVGWEEKEQLPAYFTVPAGETVTDTSPYGVGQFLDDVGNLDDQELFERINVYSEKNVTLNKHRVLVHHLLPYRLVQSSKGYTLYRHMV